MRPPKNSRRCSFIVLTGGPGAGKTAVLEIMRRRLIERLTVIPEAASIIFSGGFWRREEEPMRKAAQRAIYYVQREMENAIEEEGQATIALCDRGTIDGVAYWPGSEESFWRDLETTREAELKRYTAVIHLRTPKSRQGYNHANPVRIESAREAAAIDERIFKAWDGHPNRVVIASTDNFLEKVHAALEAIKAVLAQIEQK